jgi:hypothetical protein
MCRVFKPFGQASWHFPQTMQRLIIGLSDCVSPRLQSSMIFRRLKSVNCPAEQVEAHVPQEMQVAALGSSFSNFSYNSELTASKSKVVLSLRLYPKVIILLLICLFGYLLCRHCGLDPQ